MRLLPIINLIKEQCPIFNGNVELLPDNLSLDDAEIIDNLPIAFVCVFEENSGESRQLRGTTQVEDYHFGVLSVAAGVTDDSEPIEDARDQVKAALLGAVLYDGAGQIQKAGGSLMEIKKRQVAWLDLFMFSGVLKSTS